MSLLFEPIDDVFGSITKIRVLRVLTYADTELRAGDIASRCGLDRHEVIQALRDLTFASYVNRVVVRRRSLYSINKQNVLVADMQRLFDRELERVNMLIGVLEEVVYNETPHTVAAAYLVGSKIAATEDAPRSDLELLAIVRSPDLVESVTEQLAARLLWMRYRFGAFITPTVMTQEDFTNLFDAGDEFAVTAVGDYRALRGPALERLARRLA